MLINNKAKFLTIGFIILSSVSILFPVKTITIMPINQKQSSQIFIRKDDKIQIKATGKWSLLEKYDLVGPEGHQITANDLGNWGTLLGVIGDNPPFVIGQGLEFSSQFEGVLYLYPNKGDYKIDNPKGYLEVTIDGGIELDKFKKQIGYKAKKFTFNAIDKMLVTNIYITKGDTLEIYAFGEWTMWKDAYPVESANGHETFISNGVRWGKLYAGIGSSFGYFAENISIGEKAKFQINETGILSFYPYLDNYEAVPDGNLEIYILGGKEADDSLKNEVNEKITKNIEEKIISRLNEIRTGCSLPTFEINKILSETARNHAKYIAINNSLEREEQEDNPGFTGKTVEDRTMAKGFENKCTEAFCITDDPINALDIFIDSVYHRLKFLYPYIKYIGYGTYKENNVNVHVFDLGFIGEKDTDPNWETMMFPFNESTDVKTSWSGLENPDPFPSGTEKPTGYPASILFSYELKKIVKAEMVDEDGKQVSIYLITPDNDINKKQTNSVTLVPKKPLNFDTRYIINVTVKLGEKEEEKKYSWSFITEREKGK